MVIRHRSSDSEMNLVITLFSWFIPYINRYSEIYRWDLRFRVNNVYLIQWPDTIDIFMNSAAGTENSIWQERTNAICITIETILSESEMTIFRDQLHHKKGDKKLSFYDWRIGSEMFHERFLKIYGIMFCFMHFSVIPVLYSNRTLKSINTKAGANDVSVWAIHSNWSIPYHIPLLLWDLSCCLPKGKSGDGCLQVKERVSWESDDWPGWGFNNPRYVWTTATNFEIFSRDQNTISVV